LHHADIAEITFAEIEPSEIPHHQRKTFRRGLSKPNCFSRLFDEFGIQPCAPRYLELTGVTGGADLIARAEIAAGRAEIASWRRYPRR